MSALALFVHEDGHRELTVLPPVQPGQTGVPAYVHRPVLAPPAVNVFPTHATDVMGHLDFETFHFAGLTAHGLPVYLDERRPFASLLVEGMVTVLGAALVGGPWKANTAFTEVPSLFAARVAETGQLVLTLAQQFSFAVSVPVEVRAFRAAFAFMQHEENLAAAKHVYPGDDAVFQTHSIVVELPGFPKLVEVTS